MGTTESVVNSMSSESITTALGTVKEMVTWVVGFIGENPVFMVFFVAGLIPVGVKVFKSIKNAVKR